MDYFLEAFQVLAIFYFHLLFPRCLQHSANRFFRPLSHCRLIIHFIQNSLAKLEEKVKERAASKSQPKKSHVEEMMAKLPQNIVYSAKIRQVLCHPLGPFDCRLIDFSHLKIRSKNQKPKLHWSTNDGHLLHRGLLWKKEEKKDDEIRYMALLFSDVLLLTNVRPDIF